MLEAGHPAAALVERLRAIESAQLYDAQQKLLQSIHGEDLFVAGFQAMERNGEILTLTTWAEGVDTLIPRCRAIAIVTAAQQRMLVDWSHVEQVVGHRMEATRYYPDRVRVASFPTPEELAVLARLAHPS